MIHTLGRVAAMVLVLCALPVGTWGDTSRGARMGEWRVGDETRPDGRWANIEVRSGQGSTSPERLILSCYKSATEATSRLYLIPQAGTGSLRVGNPVPVTYQVDARPVVTTSMMTLGPSGFVDQGERPPLGADLRDARRITISGAGQTWVFDLAGAPDALYYLAVSCPALAVAPAPTPDEDPVSLGDWLMSHDPDRFGVLAYQAMVDSEEGRGTDNAMYLVLACAPGRRADMLWMTRGPPGSYKPSPAATYSIDGAPFKPFPGYGNDLDWWYTTSADLTFGGLAGELSGARKLVLRAGSMKATFPINGVQDALASLARDCQLAL